MFTIVLQSDLRNIFNVMWCKGVAFELITASSKTVFNELFFYVPPQHLQGQIQTGSKGSQKPVKQFRFLKQSIKINYQILDYKKISTWE